MVLVTISDAAAPKIVEAVGQVAPNAAWYMPRANVASFLLRELNHPTPGYLRQCIAIALSKK